MINVKNTSAYILDTWCDFLLGKYWLTEKLTLYRRPNISKINFPMVWYKIHWCHNDALDWSVFIEYYQAFTLMKIKIVRNKILIW